MSELNEMTRNKSTAELQALLADFLAQGESLGGTICSHVVHCIHLSKAGALT